MANEDREALVAEIVETQPSLRKFVRDLPSDMIAGSWDMLSFSFQHGFEAMWDLAKVDHSGLLLRPLLSLWRQSIELAVKAALLGTTGSIEGKPGHNLQKLFEQLLKVRADAGCCDDDDLTVDVRAMIEIAQSFDPTADRFRYPADRNDKPYDGVDVNLDELFQSHWIIVTWCEGSVIELKGDI